MVSARTTILLVDDQHLLRLGFGLMFEAEPDLEIAGEAGDGAEALRLTGHARADMALMDVRMPA